MHNTKMLFCPVSGERGPVPDDADAWREQHRLAWLFNPWTGNQRERLDIERDRDGRLLDESDREPGAAWALNFVKDCGASRALTWLESAGWTGDLDSARLVVTLSKGPFALTFRLKERADEERLYILLHDEAFRCFTS
ncbi:hypothetical protein Q3P06_25150 [Ralstonia pseudosolanacearum]|uniref:hypothetical protein n=1 Tax=Ralstonia pseudosolanacearum TaxID=1310165 RepID=UPI002676691B|nr:hypothetical protein [Ralstonia pseudosolanacearum]MDO3515176.1 hypothetical protein [Ralstonia pseudosolanacearum]MDO3634016.1 hypothetical protein [Ralstonia pseudosolanacearum]